VIAKDLELIALERLCRYIVVNQDVVIGIVHVVFIGTSDMIEITQRLIVFTKFNFS